MLHYSSTGSVLLSDAQLCQILCVISKLGTAGPCRTPCEVFGTVPQSSRRSLAALPQSARTGTPDLLDLRPAPQCHALTHNLVALCMATACGIATDPHMPRRWCVRCCRTTSVERFADQSPSASPLPWTVPTGAKTHLFDCVCRA